MSAGLLVCSSIILLFKNFQEQNSFMARTDTLHFYLLMSSYTPCWTPGTHFENQGHHVSSTAKVVTGVMIMKPNPFPHGAPLYCNN